MTRTTTLLATMAATIALLFVTIGSLELIQYFVDSPVITVAIFFGLVAVIGLAVTLWLDWKDSGNAGS